MKRNHSPPMEPPKISSTGLEYAGASIWWVAGENAHALRWREQARGLGTVRGSRRLAVRRTCAGDVQEGQTHVHCVRPKRT